jgi:hypothetical protein
LGLASNSIALMLFAVIIGWSLFVRRQDLMLSVQFVMAAAMGLAFLPIGFRMYRDAGQWYRFTAGRLQLCSGAGKAIWDEDLSTVVSASINYGDGPQGFLELVWKHATRKIGITADLANAIRSLESDDARGATE